MNTYLPANTTIHADTLSITVAGSGGTGALTTGNLLLDASARQGCYGALTRTVGPQIRGGEAAAMLQLSGQPVDYISDNFDIFLAMDWNNIERYADEIPLGPDSIIIADPAQGEVPAVITTSAAQIVELPIRELAKQVKKGRANMIALGALAEIIGLSEQSIQAVLRKQLLKKGEQVLQSSLDTVAVGRRAAADIAKRPLPVKSARPDGHWIITGNQAAGLGAVRGGIRFVAAYPITPATEIMEWLSAAFVKVGGTLVQAEDELASANMVIGASYGGVPSLTATSGPGLALMMESLGLAVSAEIPLVVIDVMRAGPSTGIPTKSEQSDLNIAVYGFHGDAPHLVLAPTSVADCLFTCQWSVYLAEAMQVPAIMLSDQYMGQARTVIDPPPDVSLQANRDVAIKPAQDYQRYAVTQSGVSPMSIPGTPAGQYNADGLEHNPLGNPSSSVEDHSTQMDKRLRKISSFDYGEHWAELAGEGKLTVITWGSTTGAVREALKRLHNEDILNVRLMALRLLAPTQPEKFTAALQGVDKVLIVEQSHSAQFYHYLCAHYDLPAEVTLFHRAGPMLIRPGEIVEKIKLWSGS